MARTSFGDPRSRDRIVRPVRHGALLTCAVQNYDWGITGDSEVASLGERNTGTSADREKPYAELWMGTHPSGPSIVKGTGVG